MFDSRGLLPQDQSVSLEDLAESFFVKGKKSSLNWNLHHRKMLVENFISLATILKRYGVRQVLDY